MNELKRFTLEELRMAKYQLIHQIKELQAKTRVIDKEVKVRFNNVNQMVEKENY